MFESILGFILVITPLVFIHELGHYIMARYSGIQVLKFSVGFGKELIGYTDKLGTRWCISLIPLGGYVKMLGEDSFQQGKDSASDAPDDLETVHAQNTLENLKGLDNAPLLSRMAVVSFGPLANIILALSILFSINFIYGTYSMPDYQKVGLGNIAPNSPASLAGLQSGDVITSLNNTKINEFSDILVFMRDATSAPILIQYRREDEMRRNTITPKVMIDYQNNKRMLLGVSSPLPEKKTANGITALKTAIQQTYLLGTQILYGIGGMFSGSVNYADLGGPIKIAQYSGQNFNDGIETFLLFAAMLSVNLAIINLLPIPGLDGGHFMLMMMEGILRRKPPRKMIMIMNNAGVMFVFLLIIVISLKDVYELFI